MRVLTFWFPSDTNTSHFKDVCEKLDVVTAPLRIPYLRCEVDDATAQQLTAAAEELGGVVGEYDGS